MTNHATKKFQLTQNAALYWRTNKFTLFLLRHFLKHFLVGTDLDSVFISTLCNMSSKQDAAPCLTLFLSSLLCNVMPG